MFLSKDVYFMRNDNLFPRDFFFKKQIHGSMMFHVSPTL